jgi:hypothetical protein
MGGVASLLGVAVSLSALVAVPVGLKLMRVRRHRREAKRELNEYIETFK